MLSRTDRPSAPAPGVAVSRWAMAALRSMSGAAVGDVSGSAKAVTGMSRHAAIENSRASRSVGRVIGGEYHWAGRGPSELLGRPIYE